MALALAGPAAAQGGAGSSVTQDQYADSASRFSGGGGSASDPTGSLPFTGLDLALMGAAAGCLLGMGVLLRRRAASEDASE